MFRLNRLLKSFRYASRGFLKTWKEEQNLQIQSLAGTIVFILAIYFHASRQEWIMLVFIVGLVILMELANSAVERIADVLKPRLNTYVKEIKDVTAAAVMVSSLVALIVGVLIFWPHIFK
jgi:diacylglycerol kinase